MRLIAVQADIIWGDVEGNLRHLSGIIDGAGPADIYVLPEMWSTGFTMTPEIHSEKEPGAALNWMIETAARTGAAVAGSISVEAEGLYRNRFYFVKPDGSISYYDKRHLFTYSGEDRHYTAGSEKVVVEWKGVRFRLIVCYDLRFPTWCRCSGDYDACLCVASWPDRRSGAWKALLKARAIENQCYMIGVNRVGTDTSCTYSGDTSITDAYGSVIAECLPGQEGWCCADLNLADLQDFREKFPVLKDAD